MTAAPWAGLTPREQKMVLPLVRDCLDDAEVFGIFADLFDPAFPFLARELRERPCVRLLIASLELGDWRARAHASRCRGVVRDVGRVLRGVRQYDTSKVGIEELPDGTAWVSLAERAAIERAGEGDVLRCLFADVFEYLCSYHHCCHLSWLALDVVPVAAELEENVPAYVGKIRDACNLKMP